MDDQKAEMDIYEWLQYGISRGWCSETHCATHDGVPSTEGEDADWEEGFDPCQVVVRIWS